MLQFLFEKLSLITSILTIINYKNRISNDFLHMHCRPNQSNCYIKVIHCFLLYITEQISKDIERKRLEFSINVIIRKDWYYNNKDIIDVIRH